MTQAMYTAPQAMHARWLKFKTKEIYHNLSMFLTYFIKKIN